MPTVLLVAASPHDQDRLRLSNQIKEIKQALKRSRNREQWTIETNEAATVDDLRRSLLDFRPTIVHFCGHGGGTDGLAFEDNDGNTHETHAEPLAKLFHQFKDTLKCVVLNACYSEVQANNIQQQIDYVVGMTRGIDDESATKFAVAFYDAVFAETTFRMAFDIACTAINLSNLPDYDVPVFLTGPNLGGITLPYTSMIPTIEDTLLAYYNTPFSSRFKFTTRGEQIAEAMRQFYGDKFHRIIDKVTIESMKQIDAEYWRVLLHILVKDNKGTGEAYIRIRDRNIQVEWEASVGYWSMPPQTYIALGTDKPITVRVRAQLGNSYYGAFHDRDGQFQNINLSSNTNYRLYGYVRRHSPEYKELLELLSDGNKHNLTLSVHNIDNDTDHVVIDSVVSNTWLVSGNESA